MGKYSEKPDIIAVAKAARVSASTVSRAFNHPELVKPATRKKIDSAVRRLGYIRNRAAQTIHGIRSATIGLIVPTIDHAIFAEVVQAFSEQVNKSGFTILLASHGYDLQNEYQVLRKLLEHRVDGVALIGMEHADETYELIEQQEIPAILIWNFDDRARLPCVGAVNYSAGEQIAAHLVEAGHRNIALMFPKLAGNDRAADRYAGTVDRLENAGISVRSDWVLEAPYSISAAKEVARELLSGRERPSAVLCGNDVIAWGVISAAKRLGLDVPGHVSVAGIGDFRAYQDLEPSLTTVRIPARRIGRLAGEAIAKTIVEPDFKIGHVCCPTDLVVRGSVSKISVPTNGAGGDGSDRPGLGSIPPQVEV